jgi:twinkle protein
VTSKNFGALKGESLNEGIPARKITGKALSDYGVTAGTDKRYGVVQIYPYYDDTGALVAQHLRTKDKDFPWLGDSNAALPFGSRVRSDTGKRLILTEGELDAVAAYQMFGMTWPVWSIGCGAGPQLRRYIGKHREIFRRFDEVVICFDNDDVGKEAAVIAAEVIGHDKAKIASLPKKDACEMLQADLIGEFKGAIYNAKRWTPDEILTVDQLDFNREISMGRPSGFPSFDELTYGLRKGEIHIVGAGTAAGKTDFLLQIVKHLLDQGVNVGTFFLEQQPIETGLRLAGKFAHLPLHVPFELGEYTEEDKEKGIDMLKGAEGSLYLYDSFGINEWEIIKERMRYLAYQAEVEVFILDHITALAAATTDERRELDIILAEMGGLVKELDVCIIAVSHLARPEGIPHEEGGRVQLRHMRGSHAISIWAHYAWGIERNQQATNPIARNIGTIRCLKDRYTGRAVAKTWQIKYSHSTGMLTDLGIDEEVRAEGDSSPDYNPFAPEEF